MYSRLLHRCILVFFSLFISLLHFCFFFFFNDTATTEIYTLSLHDALPILVVRVQPRGEERDRNPLARIVVVVAPLVDRSEEHTSELQSHSDLVCRLLLEKKKKDKKLNSS